MSSLFTRLSHVPGRLRSILCYLPYRDQSLSYEDYWDWRAPTHLAARHHVFAAWIPDGSRVLEVACGDGSFAQHLTQRKSCTVTAVDVSARAVERARQRGVNAHVMDVTRQLPEGRFDVVVLSAFIEHVVNSEEVIGRCLERGDQVVLSIPNIAYVEHRLRLLFGHFPCQWAFHPSEHVRFWSVRDFEGELEQLGIRLVERRADDGIPVLRDCWTNLFAQDVCYRLTRPT